jgi:hypothetical protein
MVEIGKLARAMSGREAKGRLLEGQGYDTDPWWEVEDKCLFCLGISVCRWVGRISPSPEQNLWSGSLQWMNGTTGAFGESCSLRH